MASETEDRYKIQDAITALLDALRTMDIGFGFEKILFRYHHDVGLMIILESKEIPAFHIMDERANLLSEFAWWVNEIYLEDDVYKTLFVLDDEI